VGAHQSILGGVLRGLQGCLQAEGHQSGAEQAPLPAEDLHAVEGAPGGGDAAIAGGCTAAQDHRQPHTEALEDRQAFLVRPTRTMVHRVSTSLIYVPIITWKEKVPILISGF